MKTCDLDSKLDSFNYETRLEAFEELVQSKTELPTAGELINMHFHSFFSYNSKGWSPFRIAWESRKNALYAAGVIEFDVIDGIEEFQLACEVLGLRSAVGVETRSFFAKFAEQEINSPGEPGVNYVIAGGFSAPLKKNSKESEKLEQFKKAASERNIALVSRINAKVPQIALDYKKDVLPLTPSGNATERHIVSAYAIKAEKNFPDKEKLVKFWSEILSKDIASVKSLLASKASFDEAIRAKFAKKGGLGYLQPGPDSFPPTADFFFWAKNAGTIPMVAWLDGCSEAEKNASAYLDASVSAGAEAVNIIPDRNWNFKDTELRKLKIAKLDEFVNESVRRALPINIGTEMNKDGQPFADPIDREPLLKYKKSFLDGAKVVVGHSILAKFAGYDYCGKWAEYDFGTDRHAKNKFFASVGSLPPLTLKKSRKLAQLGAEKAFSKIYESSQKGKWLIP